MNYCGARVGMITNSTPTNIVPLLYSKASPGNSATLHLPTKSPVIGRVCYARYAPELSYAFPPSPLPFPLHPHPYLHG